MTCLTRVACAVVLVAGAGRASAFTRETTTRGHPETGVCLAWSTRQLTFHVNPAGAAQTACGTGAATVSAIEAAFATWTGAARTGESAPCTDLTFVPGASTSVQKVGKDGVNAVMFRASRCSDVFTPGACNLSVPGDCPAKLNCWDDANYGTTTLGLTTTSFDSETGEILDADMELFAWDGNTHSLGVGGYFTCDGSTSPPTGCPGCKVADLQAVVTHEAGHVVGLDHVCSNEGSDAYKACPDPTAVMVPNVGSVSQRALAQDDVSGVCAIYPKGAATLTCASAKASSKGGCSTGGGAGVGALLGAAAAALRSPWSRRR